MRECENVGNWSKVVAAMPATLIRSTSWKSYVKIGTASFRSSVKQNAAARFAATPISSPLHYSTQQAPFWAH